MGNPVYATVGSDERVRAVEQLGAAKGINYKTQDFVKEVLDATGIGTAAVQLARCMGKPGYATVGSDERVRAVEQLGAAEGINYRTQDFVKEVLDATGGAGVNVILDMVAGDYINRNMKCLADDGRIVVIALLGGARAEVDCNQILRRRLTLTGSTLRPRPVAFKDRKSTRLNSSHVK